MPYIHTGHNEKPIYFLSVVGADIPYGLLGMPLSLWQMFGLPDIRVNGKRSSKSSDAILFFTETRPYGEGTFPELRGGASTPCSLCPCLCTGLPLGARNVPLIPLCLSSHTSSINSSTDGS